MSPPFGAEHPGPTTVSDVSRLLGIGSLFWLIHGIAMIAGLVLFFFYVLNTGLQIIPGPSSPSGALATIGALGAFGSYGLAILAALVGSLTFGLAVLRTSGAGADRPRRRLAARLFLVFAGLAMVGVVGYGLLTLGFILSDAGVVRTALVFLFGAWMLASIVLSTGFLQARKVFPASSDSPASLPTLRMTLPTVYAIVSVVGVVPFSLGVIFAVSANFALPGPVFALGALMALLAAPILVVLVFGHLLIQIRSFLAASGVPPSRP